MNTLISQSTAWAALTQHQQQLAHTKIRDLFSQDKQRFERFSVTAAGLFLDYSKNRLTTETLNLLQQLAEEAKLKEWIIHLFRGDKVNNTEQRAALHTALRNRANTPILVDGQDVMPQINQVFQRLQVFTEAVRNQQWRGHTGKSINTIVNIGIGGSDLGPAMVIRALKRYQSPNLTNYFVSNVDSTHLSQILAQINPETTLFIVASKTFTTQETLLNARSARRWLIEQLGSEQAVAQHFVAVSTATQKVVDFGIDPANMFEFWDWVGGRYSLWSAIGLPIMLAIGKEHFEELLSGAYELDQHFQTASFSHNLPVLLGLIEIWYVNFFNASTQAILPYDFSLELFPAYLQQLCMESLGKRVTREGQPVDYATGPIVWGAPGNNGQHAFYQLLHQGSHLVPADILIALHSQYPLSGHQEAVLSNALAQAHTLMQGRNAVETESVLRDLGGQGESLKQSVAHRTFPGNQPSNIILYSTLSPKTLGALIALYEHKVFVESVCWGLNPFDQWGVELGKQVANSLLPVLSGENRDIAHDPSTDGLIRYIQQHR